MEAATIAPTPPDPFASGVSPEASPPPASILLVDDRPENLLALRAILDPLDLRLVEAQSGTQALKYLLNEDFALILMDVQMPGLDGFETAAMIKERERTRHIPIIFVTAISKEQHYVFKGYSSGAVDYIAKPFDPDILRSKVGVFVDLWAKGEQIKRQAELLHISEQMEREREVERLEREAEKRQRQLEQRHIEELAASEASLARFKATLDATLDSVFIFDPETLRYTYANQGALRQLGYAEEEMLTMTSVDIKPEMSEESFRRLLQPLRDGQQNSIRFETIHRRCDGTLMPVEVFMQFIATDGDDGRFISIGRDITQRKKAEEALIAARDVAERERAEAQKANRAKSDFIAGISHELRTPLNAILGFSKLLLNPRVGPLNDDQMAYTKDVVDSAEHLLQLINDVLDLSKIEAGKMTLEEGTWSVGPMLEQSLTVVRDGALAQKMNLSVEIEPEAAALPPLEGDPRKIKQVLFNLLSNAVKFTPAEGAISLRARCSHGDAGRELVVSVCDSGIGVAPEDHERIFQAFEQVDSSYTRTQQGTGLGLALSRRIIEMHKGRMTLESAPGKGSTFSFALPLPAQVEVLASTHEPVEKAEKTSSKALRAKDSAKAPAVAKSATSKTRAAKSGEKASGVKAGTGRKVKEGKESQR